MVFSAFSLHNLEEISRIKNAVLVHLVTKYKLHVVQLSYWGGGRLPPSHPLVSIPVLIRNRPLHHPPLNLLFKEHIEYFLLYRLTTCQKKHRNLTTRRKIGILYQQPIHAQTHWIYQQKAGLFLFPLKKTSSNYMTWHSKTLTLVLYRTGIVKKQKTNHLSYK